MRIHTLAHVSDLHMGATTRHASVGRAIAETLAATRIDHIVITGDLTHRGRASELDAYHEAFASLIAEGRVTCIPGNHDRLGDDVRDRIMSGARVQVATAPGLHIVRVDSTGAHNRQWLQGHGKLTPQDVLDIDAALDDAAPFALRVVSLHHHVLPLPEDSFGERLSTWLGWPYTRELDAGHNLLERIHARCDLVLHGHRHVPSSRVVAGPHRHRLQICNAGSSTQLGRVRLFAHRDGELCIAPVWLDVTTDARSLGARDFHWLDHAAQVADLRRDQPLRA